MPSSFSCGVFFKGACAVSAFQDLFEKCTGQALILTPNQRLGRQVQSQYALMQQANGHGAWASPHVVSWAIWVQEQWADFASAGGEAAPYLMSGAQEEAIWLRVLREDEGVTELFDIRATAKECRRAWVTLVQWEGDVSAVPGLEPMFVGWCEAFKDYCTQYSLIDMASATESLVQGFNGDGFSLPSQVVMVAFDDVTPQMQRLMEVLNARGVEVQHWSPEVACQRVSRVALGDAKQEIDAAARWAAALVEREGDARIGVVFPNLVNQRAQVERMFMEVFEAQYTLPESPRHAPPFNISAGVSLSECPIIDAALLALKLNYRNIEIDILDKLLHSPFIGQLDELPSRSMLFELLKEKHLHMSMAGLRAVVGEFGFVDRNAPSETGSPLLPDLYERLHNWLNCSREHKKHQAPSEWGKLMCLQWQALGWPGQRSLDTLEYQQVDVWQNAIGGLNHYDHIFPSVSLSQAIELIERIAADTQFQPQTMDSPVQVLGLFEAAGSVFDYLWVANLDNETWPSPIRPNALLPLGLQKEKKMPLASVEKELDLAKRMTQRFEHSCRELVISHFLMDGEKSLSVSPIVAHFPERAIGDLPSLATRAYAELLFEAGKESGKTETLRSEKMLPVVDVQSIRGGTQILKDQAACPFRAFARHRLQAKARDERQPGIDAALKGALVHRSLELIWKQLKTQEALLALDDERLSGFVRDCIATSLNDVDKTSKIGPCLRAIEAARVQNLILAWLQLEKQRAPFTVAGHEAKQSVNLAGLPVNIRCDRMDTLDDGQSTFVLDYKTSKVAVRSWVGERPDEPQVPLYALANKNNVTGVAFGQLNFEGVEIKGVGESEDIAQGISIPEALTKLDLPATWPDIIQYWQDNLEGLATEFLQGHADVAPKHASVTCRYCDLQNLCRIKSQKVEGEV